MRRGIAKLLGAALLVALAVPAGSASADPLRDALAKAYVGNPTLRAARAGQRATDEQVPQALSGWRPTVTVQDSAGPSGSWSWMDAPGKSKTTIDNSAFANKLTLSLNQPLFSGFGTVEGTAAAESNVKSGQQNLLATEQQVLFNAVQAYMNVYMYRELVTLQKQNVSALQSQLGATNERFKVGEITRTDVAEANASLSQAKGQLAAYQAQLAANEATYLQIVGTAPGATPYPGKIKLPSSLDAAYRIAGEKNPQILAQAFAEDAALHTVGVKRAPLLPEVDLQASVSRTDAFGNYAAGYSTTGVYSGYSHAPDAHAIDAQVGVVASIPLYDAGYNWSLVREAKQLASEQRINVIVVARQIRQVVAQAWTTLVGTRNRIAYDGDQIRAAQIALDGVKQEFQAGTRTTYDVLQAQQTLVNAQISAVQDRYNEIVYAYQLLSGIGQLTAADLHLNVPLYDPNENYRRVRNKWIGSDVKTVN